MNQINLRTYLNQLKGILNYPDGLRVLSLLKALFGNAEVGEHFTAGGVALDFNTVYDSAYLPHSDMYNIVKVTKDEDHVLVAISLNGSSLAGASTEYVRFKPVM